MRVKNIGNKKTAIYNIHGVPYWVRPNQEKDVYNIVNLPNCFKILSLTRFEKTDPELRLRILAKGNFYKKQLEALVGPDKLPEDLSINAKPQIQAETVIKEKPQVKEEVVEKEVIMPEKEVVETPKKTIKKKTTRKRSSNKKK